MKKTFTFLLLGLVLIGTPVLAQKGVKKIYVAHVNNSDTTITKRDRDEITFQAKSTIKNLEELLVLVTSTIPTENQLDKSIKESYLITTPPNSSQIFYNDGIVIEDDIDPRHTSSQTTADLPVDRYLKNLALFYSKSDEETIKFSRIITSTLIEGKAFPYVKVFFTSTFTGKYTDPNNQTDVAYQPLQRVAELRVEKVDGKWRTLIVRLGFPKPGEGLTISETKPVISPGRVPAKPVAGKEFLYRSTDNTSDSISAKWDKNWLTVIRSTTDKVPLGSYQYRKIDNTSQAFVSITLTNNDKLLAFRQTNGSSLAFGQVVPSKRLVAWLQIVAGTAALGASYVGYSSLQRSYNDYTSKLTSLNAEYAVWQTLSQQPGDSPAKPMSFTSYAQPGIYGVYGGGLVGSGLIVNGIRQLLKSGR
jgi:hypothetical protein